MNTRPNLLLWAGLIFLLGLASAAQAEVYISEVLIHPPGSDSTNEYVELRGTPNLTLPNGIYLISVEGDTAGNPGTVQNIFDLSGRRIGQNGFLVLLQKFHRYKPNPLCTVLTNSDSGSGWGSGSSSSVKHRGENGQTELENASCTLFLIQSDVAPSIGDDIDADDDGIPDGVSTNWTVLDSVGLMDRTQDNNQPDIAYGKINFVPDSPPTICQTGTVVTVQFTPSYVARNGNTTDWAATNWVASDKLLGTAPRWFLGGVSASLGTNTLPVKRAKAALNHIGGPNFKAPVLPGVIVRESGTNTLVTEAGLKDSYLLSLATQPMGAVSIRIEAPLPAEVSVDGGRTYGGQATAVLTSKTARKVLVRARDDGAAGANLRKIQITHSVVATGDPGSYPTNTLILPVTVTVVDTNVVLLSELKVNPPGTDDPFEFIELRGPAGKMLTNLWIIALGGNSSANPGRVDFALNLTGQRMGSNGLLVVAAPGNPYSFSPATTIVLAPRLANPGGALDNGSVSLLLVGTSTGFNEGDDLDNGDNGVLEGLPNDAFIQDAVAWSDGGNNDEIYGGVDLSQQGFTPDAASRLPDNLVARSAAAWMVGDLSGSTGDSLIYDPRNLSTNVPPGSVLSPGVINRIGPRITPNPLPPLSAVIDDPENESATFTVSDPDSPSATLQLSVTSSNQLVAPDANLSLTNLGGGAWKLSMRPIGVGYSQIIVTVHDGIYSRRALLAYAASAPGRPGAKWHTGVSDASTAIAIDANWMIVGDDENQVLRTFSRTRSGGAVAEHDFSPDLKLIDRYTNGLPKEVDIEASTRVGNRLFWLGSHSHAFDATERTNRARLFATDLSGSGTNAQLKYVGHYNYLKVDLLEWDAHNDHGKGANYYGLVDSGAIGVNPKEPDGSGFNLEGLAMAPGSTTNAYLGFRAPLVPPDARALALVVPVRNFARLATKGGGQGSALFGPPIELNLGGRGIRSMEGIGTNYLIIAGPPGAGDHLPPPGNFRLFTWSGQPDDVPQERDADLTGLNPEGIVEVPPGPWTATNLFQIVSDNGTNEYYGDGIQAKHLGAPQFKKFRVDWLALGNLTNSAPLIRAVSASAGDITVSWFAKEGLTYRVQTRAAWDDAWSDAPGDLTATAALARKTIPTPADRQCFFRVVVVQP
jgi:hypothetical protein